MKSVHQQFSTLSNQQTSKSSNNLFIYDWMRNWIQVVRLDENGDYSSMEPFMPSTNFDKIIDMELGPDGSLYLLEYGTNWYSSNENA